MSMHAGMGAFGSKDWWYWKGRQPPRMFGIQGRTVFQRGPVQMNDDEAYAEYQDLLGRGLGGSVAWRWTGSYWEPRYGFS